MSDVELSGSKTSRGREGFDLTASLTRINAPLRDQVIQALRREIVELRLLPGERLVERELIARTGVSRSTIREALSQLVAEQLVEMVPQKGAIVAMPSPREAAEVYEVRALLEAGAARACAERATAEQKAKVRAAFTDVESAVAAGIEVPARIQLTNRLFGALLDGTANATIRDILDGLNARISSLRATTMSTPGRPEKSVEELREIVEAVERGDGEAAGLAAERHVRNAAALLLPLLEQREHGGLR